MKLKLICDPMCIQAMADYYRNQSERHLAEAKENATVAIDRYKELYVQSEGSCEYAILEAIIIACNSRMLIQSLLSMHGITYLSSFLDCTEYLGLAEMNLEPHVYSSIVKNLISRKASSQHVEYLLLRNTKIPGSGAACQSGCNLSSVSALKLLDLANVSEELVSAAIKQGMEVNLETIEHAIKVLPDDDLPVLEALVLNHHSCEHTALCSVAVKSNKISFAKFFESKGAKPPAKELILQQVFLNETLIKYLAAKLSQSERTELLQPLVKKHDCAILLESGPINPKDVNLCSIIISLVDNKVERVYSNEIRLLLESGVDPNGLPGCRTKPIETVMSLPAKKCCDSTKSVLIADLVKHGAELGEIKIEGSTLVHKITQLVLRTGNIMSFYYIIILFMTNHFHSTGNVETLELVCSSFPFPESGKLIDRFLESPLHIVMKAQNTHPETSFKVCSILAKQRINPNLKDRYKKKAFEYGPKKDSRRELLKKAAEDFQVITPQKRKPKTARKNKAESADKAQQKGLTNSSHEKTPILESSQKASNPINEMLQLLLSKDNSYFMVTAKDVPEKGISNDQYFQSQKKANDQCLQSQNPDVSNPLLDKSSGDENDQCSDAEEDVQAMIDSLDDLPWEVEFTEEVKKFLKDDKHPLWKRCQTIAKIARLANGERTPKLCKDVSLDKGACKVYESRITKSARILWEVAVQFSDRCTSKDKQMHGKSNHVYSEVIRVWDIVHNHDKINHCVRRIETSHKRGRNATSAVCFPLTENTSRHSSGYRIVLPQKYLKQREPDCNHTCEPDCNHTCEYVPAVSTKDDEYSPVIFYPVTSTIAKSILTGGIAARRDFPFKGWPKEHDIINLPEQESILLLGRSGTGKTTCCLYRLWNQFHNYWSKTTLGSPLLFRKCSQIEEGFLDEKHCDTQCESSVALSADEHEAGTSTSETPFVSEHLHQIFVTKNYILCSQMKKRFYDLAAANENCKEHLPFEDQKVYNSFLDIDELAYPLFLTARQFFVLIDNSLPKSKTFFPRSKDGSLAIKISSSDYDHEDPDTLLDLEESDDEMLEALEEDLQQQRLQKDQVKVTIGRRMEVTASYFCKNIWPKIRNDKKHLDPLLVWMEIKSFIKGSSQAVRKKCGYLSEEEYCNLGKKMAYNFAGNRQEIYKLFEAYKDFIQRSDIYLFDECDLVHSVYQRFSLTGDLNWSVHNFYIDEVQDFTQAELMVFLQCCRDPNGLFLTGDTAQSIMRGVSFRFKDLVSLFHEARELPAKAKEFSHIAVPKVHTLETNFRSHSGILSLASSITDIIEHFFPYSFDKLAKEVGMLPGPKPILVQSADVGDLAVLMRGNKRDKSSIEFGAHQVIIVYSKESKESLPTDLQDAIVLTIFEAKGLEFDDVLLYNFFKDSFVSFACFGCVHNVQV